MDTLEVNILTGTAAAAIVFAIALTLRLGRRVRVQRSGAEIVPSRDLSDVLEVAMRHDNVASIAKRLVDAAEEPWRWNLSEHISQLDPTSQRDLLEVLCDLELCDAHRITPSVKEPFDSRIMKTPYSQVPDPADVWIVAGIEKVGYRVTDRVPLKAETTISTIDAWVLLDESCVVGRALRARAENLLPGGDAGRYKWRATWGIKFPEDLRNMFDEPTLAVWRMRMIEDLNPAYDRRPQRQLTLVGYVGHTFEGSTMEARGHAPQGDSVVEALVKRDGTPQQGLACPGGSPLLLAVVKAKRAIRRVMGG